MYRSAILSALVLTVALIGCETASEAPAEATQVQAAGEATPTAAAHEGHEKKAAEGHDCADGADTTKLENATVETRTAEDGSSYTHLGGELTGAAEVTVADLVADPDKWAGKTVAVKGNVSAMCGHKRAWFAIAGEGDQTGTQVQIKTAPVFLVPAGSIGKTARAEGTVEVVEIPADHAKYLAAEHKMGEAEDVTGPVKTVVIRATGADFI